MDNHKTVATRRGTNKVGKWTITKQLPHDVAPTILLDGEKQNGQKQSNKGLGPESRPRFC